MSARLNLLRKLGNLQAEGPRYLNMGICSNSNVEAEEWEYLYACFKCWPKFTGDLSYPIPHSKFTYVDAYGRCKDMWDECTGYGRNRWELLDHCIRTLAVMRDIYDQDD